MGVSGRGENEPKVPTADGVRELQNRRVEITVRNGCRGVRSCNRNILVSSSIAILMAGAAPAGPSAGRIRRAGSSRSRRGESESRRSPRRNTTRKRSSSNANRPRASIAPRVDVEASAGIRRPRQPDAPRARDRRSGALSARSAGARRMGRVRFRSPPRRTAAPGGAGRRRLAARGRTLRIHRAAGRAAISRRDPPAAGRRREPGQRRVPPGAGRPTLAPGSSKARSRSPTSSRRKSGCRPRWCARPRRSRGWTRRKITLRRLTGLDIAQVQMPPTLAEADAGFGRRGGRPCPHQQSARA